MMVDWWYHNNLFAVEDGLFYENNKRLGYYQDEKEDEILQNNHKATVDRMLELKELNIEFKRIHKKLKKENKELKEEIEELKRERDDWKSSTCSYMNKDSLLSMDCQIVQEALWELEKEIEFGSKREDLFFDLKEKFEKLNNHRIGVCND